MNESKGSPTSSVSPVVARLLILLASTGFAVAVLFAFMWLRATPRGRIHVDQLGPEDRQALVEEIMSGRNAALVPAWFYPRIAYTLRYADTLSAFGDTFTTNDLGYRTGPVEKDANTFRIVFVGDSWTFGYGVREDESFAAQLEELANLHAGSEQPIESWVLALGGYNLMNELAAFRFFFDRLEPDAVVICPTRNDAGSTAAVLPDGSLARLAVTRDEFGESHHVRHPAEAVDSYRLLKRWDQSFTELRSVEMRLKELSIPMMVFFAAYWDEAFAHSFMERAGVEAPYAITPTELTKAKWRNPPPHRHATPAANLLFAQMIYQGLAPIFGWDPLPEVDRLAVVEVFTPPVGGEWGEICNQLLRAETQKSIGESFTPGPGADRHCVGPIDELTGLFGRATSVMVRRAEGAQALSVRVRRVPGALLIYPMQLTVRIPSPSDEIQVSFTIPADGPESHSFEIPIPGGIAVGSAMDVVLEAEHAAAAPNSRAPRSLFLENIAPVIR